MSPDCIGLNTWREIRVVVDMRVLLRHQYFDGSGSSRGHRIGKTNPARIKNHLDALKTNWRTPCERHRADYPKLDDAEWHVFTGSQYDAKTGEWQMSKLPVHRIIRVSSSCCPGRRAQLPRLPAADLNASSPVRGRLRWGYSRFQRRWVLSVPSGRPASPRPLHRLRATRSTRVRPPALQAG